MRMIIGDVWQQDLDATSVSITRSASDPVSTCSFNIIDNTASYQPQELQEVLILDTKAIPNPTDNMLTYPDLNPYNAFSWNINTLTGVTSAQNGGGGAKFTLSNVAVGSHDLYYQSLGSYSSLTTPGVSYDFSAFIQGTNTPTNFNVYIKISWYDINSNFISSTIFNGPNPPSTSTVRYSVQSTAPANSFVVNAIVGITVSNSTNSGAFIVTKAQFEPMWFSDMSYPSTWCGPGQTNCVEMDYLFPRYIRQSRKFAGFITLYTVGDYHGNIRTWQITASGYAWLFSLITVNDTFTNQYDSAMITSLITKYFNFSPIINGYSSTFSLTNVKTGKFIASYQCNWDDLRTIMDNFCAQSGFYWTIDYYWNLIYQEPGSTTMAIQLILDNSAHPNMSTTFPGYGFSSDGDFTQPGDSILVLGSGSNVSIVTDTVDLFNNFNTLRWVQIPQNFVSFRYQGALLLGAFFIRKINDSNLQSTLDTNVRGVAESIQYNTVRKIYHITTNVELIPGQNIQITSSTDGLSTASLLIQQTTATWLGTDETLTDIWEYQSDLGAVNHTASRILSRIFRNTTSNTTTPSIVSNVVYNGTYQSTVLGDGPVAYYTLGDSSGTSATDIAGKSYTGTIHGGVTLGVAGLLTHPVDTAMTFNGSTGYISLPTTFVPTGANPWSLEAWVRIPSNPGGSVKCGACGMGLANTHQQGVIGIYTTTPAAFFISTFGTDFTGGTANINTTYHIVGTYDGTNVRLYVNGSLIIGPSAVTLNLSANFATIGANGSSPNFPGTLDEIAFYNYCLSQAQISNHYTVGTS